ncbi:MAG: MarR family transcriptional regulator [Acetatifactor sp.]|nr:MarR family transcriptional regulator [Acetatifactor sp.]
MNNYVSKEMKRYNHLLGEIQATYHEISLKLGLSDSAMIILYTICNEGDSYPLSEICRLSGLSKQTVNSAIRKLETEGILYLAKAGSKNKTVCLTAAGKELAGKTALRLLNAENAILASWPRQDVEKYLELTEKFLSALRAEAAGL